MRKFKVIVEGVNYLFPSDKGIETVGFFSTFIISCPTYDQLRVELEKKIVERVVQNNLEIVCGEIFGSYTMIESIYTEGEGEIFDQADGFTFYKMSFLARVTGVLKKFFYRIFSPKRLLLVSIRKKDESIIL